MDDEERQRLAVGLIQTIAMQAMEIPAEDRPEFIKRAVLAVRREFERKHTADPMLTDATDKLQAMIEAMVKIIEESGGTIGHA